MSSALDTERAGRFAELALHCVGREYPYHPAHVLRHAGDLQPPRTLHPAFYGCFDWHSAVHGHWLLAHVLRRHPEAPHAAAIRAALDENLSEANLAVEARYLESHPWFERPYGWAWLLKLAQELHALGDSNGLRWLSHLEPALRAVERNYLAWLPKQTYPIRTGTHTNTAFGLAFALDYARSFGVSNLDALVSEKSVEYFGADRNYPAAWEPGGNDFFSPCLMEADLMRRVLPNFPAWFAAYLPDIPPQLLEPAAVSDRSDGQLVHLDGLNLSRASCYYSLAAAVPERKALLIQSAERHLAAGLANVASGHYEGEHWLATFAANALACALEGATTTPASRSAAT